MTAKLKKVDKVIKQGWINTKLAAVKTWSLTKLVGNCIKKYSDICIAIPIVSILFATSYIWLRMIDNTAQILDIGSVSILLFNILVLGCIFSTAYFYFALFFKDLFQTGWEKLLDNPRDAYLINLALWLSTLIISYLVLTKNL